MKKIGKRAIRYSIIGIFFSLAVSMFAGCSSSPSEGKRITLVGTADIQGLMEPFKQCYEINGSKKEVMGGGISRIASVIQEAREKNPLGTFVLSSGDDLMGRYFHTFKGDAIYSLMSRSGYMLYAPGNH